MSKVFSPLGPLLSMRLPQVTEGKVLDADRTELGKYELNFHLNLFGRET